MKPLISTSEATELIQSSIVSVESEQVLLEDALDRILAEDITADRDAPPFDRVMMDGICLHSSQWEEGSWRYKIIGTQAAGEERKILPKGEFCLEVMTGATLPQDADCIIPVEQIDILDGYALPHDGIEVEAQRFIHKKGSDSKQGDILLTAGTRLGAAELAIAASAGKTELSVSRLPKLHLLTTGDEVIGPSETPTDFQIRRSHPAAIHALIKSNTLGTLTDEHLLDDEQAIEQAIASALKNNDALILTGGISMGKFDWVAPLLEKLLGEPTFHGVAQRPGKPFAFWKSTDTTPAVFALPGNPASVMATMHRYVIPALRQMSGEKHIPRTALLAENFTWDFPLTGFIPYRLENGQAKLYSTRNSGDYIALAGTNGFAEIPPQSNLAEGYAVDLY
mgnify:CR=1 FL=1